MPVLGRLRDCGSCDRASKACRAAIVFRRPSRGWQATIPPWVVVTEAEKTQMRAARQPPTFPGLSPSIQNPIWHGQALPTGSFAIQRREDYHDCMNQRSQTLQWTPMRCTSLGAPRSDGRSSWRSIRPPFKLPYRSMQDRAEGTIKSVHIKGFAQDDGTRDLVERDRLRIAAHEDDRQAGKTRLSVLGDLRAIHTRH